MGDIDEAPPLTDADRPGWVADLCDNCNLPVVARDDYEIGECRCARCESCEALLEGQDRGFGQCGMCRAYGEDE